MESSRPPIRWKSALLIVALVAVGIFLVWSLDAPSRQRRVIRTFFLLVLGGGLLSIWFFFFSRLSARVRIGGLVLGLLLAVGAKLCLRIEEVSGDLVPTLAWEWTPPRDLSAPTPSEPPASTRPLVSDRDFPAYLGADRSGRVEGVTLDPNWEASPPKLLWQRDVGAGWSAFAVSGEDAITQEQRGEQEAVVCYDRVSGEPRWVHVDDEAFVSTLAGDGPRATPTIHEGTVYTLGATGLLQCLDQLSGQRRWWANIVEDAKADIQEYGMTSSPLIVGDLVVVSAGGSDGNSLVAYDRQSGERRWAAGDDVAGNSSPQLSLLHDIPQILMFNQGSVVSHAPETGELLWTLPFAEKTEHVAQPLVVPGNRLFVSTGYGEGGTMFQIDTPGPDGRAGGSAIYKTKDLKAKFATHMVLVGEHIYGLDDGILACIRQEDGKRVWKGGRYGHGQFLLVGEFLLISAESGDVALVRAAPDKFEELASISVIEGKTWNPPALAGNQFFVRNATQAACLELPVIAGQ